MKLLTTRPSFMCIRGPNVLNILATQTDTFSYDCKIQTILSHPFILTIVQIAHGHSAEVTRQQTALAINIQFEKHQNPNQTSNRQVPITSSSISTCTLTKAITLHYSLKRLCYTT